MLTGSSVQNITKINQSDVFIEIIQAVEKMVNVPVDLAVDGVVPVGTLLSTDDGGKTFNTLTTPAHVAGTYALDDEVYYAGHIFTSGVADNTSIPLADSNWVDNGKWNANGILWEDLTESKQARVLTTGTVNKKYLSGYDEYLEVTLFDNKILTK